MKGAVAWCPGPLSSSLGGCHIQCSPEPARSRPRSADSSNQKLDGFRCLICTPQAHRPQLARLEHDAAAHRIRRARRRRQSGNPSALSGAAQAAGDARAKRNEIGRPSRRSSTVPHSSTPAHPASKVSSKSGCATLTSPRRTIRRAFDPTSPRALRTVHASTARPSTPSNAGRTSTYTCRLSV
jgi:hypothetical protein